MPTTSKKVKACGQTLHGAAGFRAKCTQPWGTEHSHHDHTAEDAVKAGIATTFSQRNKVTYYAMHDAGLRNGSFLRRSKFGLAQFMNGDFMGFREDVHEDFKEVDTKHAERLIPKVCGGRG